MSAARLGARTVARMVGIGQRWARRDDGMIVVIYQVHRGEGTAELHFDGDDPHVPGTRFLVSFAELGSKYQLLDDQHTKEAA